MGGINNIINMRKGTYTYDYILGCGILCSWKRHGVKQDIRAPRPRLQPAPAGCHRVLRHSPRAHPVPPLRWCIHVHTAVIMYWRCGMLLNLVCLGKARRPAGHKGAEPRSHPASRRRRVLRHPPRHLLATWGCAHAHNHHKNMCKSGKGHLVGDNKTYIRSNKVTPRYFVISYRGFSP